MSDAVDGREQRLAGEARLHDVRALHYNDHGFCRICTEDDTDIPESWPCPTVGALDGAGQHD